MDQAPSGEPSPSKKSMKRDLSPDPSPAKTARQVPSGESSPTKKMKKDPSVNPSVDSSVDSSLAKMNMKKEPSGKSSSKRKKQYPSSKPSPTKKMKKELFGGPSGKFSPATKTMKRGPSEDHFGESSPAKTRKQERSAGPSNKPSPAMEMIEQQLPHESSQNPIPSQAAKIPPPLISPDPPFTYVAAEFCRRIAQRRREALDRKNAEMMGDNLDEDENST